MNKLQAQQAAQFLANGNGMPRYAYRIGETTKWSVASIYELPSYASDRERFTATPEALAKLGAQVSEIATPLAMAA